MNDGQKRELETVELWTAGNDGRLISTWGRAKKAIAKQRLVPFNSQAEVDNRIAFLAGASVFFFVWLVVEMLLMLVL